MKATPRTCLPALQGNNIQERRGGLHADLSAFELSALTLARSNPAGETLQTFLAQATGIPRRTVQRHLARLVKLGLLETTGLARATRYQAVDHSTSQSTQPEKPDGSHGEDPSSRPYPFWRRQSSPLRAREPEANLSEIPLSTQALRHAASVDRPISERTRVTYDPHLLQCYQPNQTYYLSDTVRAGLLAQGQVYSQAQAAGTFARQLANRLLIDLAWNSSRLEGNTYSLLETQQLIELGAAGQDKPIVDTQMILNHKTAIEFMLTCTEDLSFNRYTVLNLHAMLSDNLLLNPLACGTLRQTPIVIGQSAYTPNSQPQQIAGWFDQWLAKANAIEDPFEQALFTLVHLPYLQPFEDVNKRTARLAANIGLFKHNLCPLSFVDLPQSLYIQATLAVYELGEIDLLRDIFIWAYRRSCGRYNDYLQVVSAPDPLRVTYRSLIHSTVSHVVTDRLNKSEAIKFIRSQAVANVPLADQPRFIEVVENQLMSLHEGNMARYGIRPNQFDVWRATWR